MHATRRLTLTEKSWLFAIGVAECLLIVSGIVAFGLLVATVEHHAVQGASRDTAGLFQSVVPALASELASAPEIDWASSEDQP